MACQERLKGTFWGTASEEQGGYDQELEFKGSKSTNLTVNVLGRSMEASYYLDVLSDPMRMVKTKRVGAAGCARLTCHVGGACTDDQHARTKRLRQHRPARNLPPFNASGAHSPQAEAPIP